ncbi:hypothetical protein BDW74DRAFT_46565 [Aspergillus multicolor]|uniref:uncharacterized protein n=1 Tax=Aspergillus multicolor TaxID=41759 RepID=UPI003CCE436D
MIPTETMEYIGGVHLHSLRSSSLTLCCFALSHYYTNLLFLSLPSCLFFFFLDRLPTFSFEFRALYTSKYTFVGSLFVCWFSSTFELVAGRVRIEEE